MKEVIVILGTGKMAYNIGMYLLKLGYIVHWYSETKTYLSSLKKKVENEIRRITRYTPEAKDSQFEYYFHESIAAIENKGTDIVIECTSESLVKKQHVITSISYILNKYNPLLISTSSSVLPRHIHPDCIGCHFFYPVEFTRLVEIIFSGSTSVKNVEYLQTWIKKNGFSSINQNENNAFSINRLLLPIETETFRFLMKGYNPKLIDQATCSRILPYGQLTFIDMIGIDTIYESIKNYIPQLQNDMQKDYLPLINGLKELLTMRKLGKKNKNGMLIGEPLPWENNSMQSINPKSMSDHFFYLFLNTCRTFLMEGMITDSQLKLVFSSIFHSDFSLQEMTEQVSDTRCKSYLTGLFEKTHLSYFNYLS